MILLDQPVISLHFNVKVDILVVCNLIKYSSKSELVCSLRMWIRSGRRRRGKATEIYCASIVSTYAKYFISLATAVDDGDSVHILISL